MTQPRECDFCDAAVPIVEAAWAEAFPGVSPRVEWDWITDVDLDKADGMKVLLYPVSGNQVETLTRAEDLYEYRVGFVVCEKYDGTGQPPKAWMGVRAKFVETLKNTLGDQRRRPPIFPSAWPETVESAASYDAEIKREKRAFYAEFTVAWREPG